MEVQEEVMGSSMDQACVLKGKRTKRRPMSPFLTMATTSYSSGEGSGSGGAGYGDSAHNFSGVDRLTTSPSSNSGEFTQSTVDEEDMANCLILLAQGHSQKSPETVLAVSNNKVAATGTEVYQCKTCNRCFPSFQALGGHRASHKKPKIAQEEKKPVVLGHHQESVQFNEDNTILSLQIPTRDRISSPTNKSRVHECSICGAEFNSGQALGGHMRRHRPMPTVATGSHEASQEAKKPRTLLSLDLNLPAPEDDHHREPKFPFASKEQVMVFSASPLVDCHY